MSIELSADRNPVVPPAGGDVDTLIDQLLRDQRILTPVERFSQRQTLAPHDEVGRRFRELLPLSQPRPGEQYAFEVDLDRCSGCKACVTACHSLNGLDSGETWRDVGLLVGHEQVPLVPSPPPHDEPWRGSQDRAKFKVIPLQQTVTTACHHCVEPGCLLGCPVNAYEKDSATGVVRHLDDQCIGCSYCILKCPYDVPKYSARLGIVRKCDLCHGRLSDGEAPACVQACPSEAIRITVVDQESVRNRWRPEAPHPISKSNDDLSSDGEETAGASVGAWLPDAPSPQWTLPTTRYVTRRNLGELVSGDSGNPSLEPAHWPLVWMLVLTQLGVGVVQGGLVVAGLGGFDRSISSLATGVLALIGVAAGLGAGVLHLGQPLRAWRSFLGWRTSWLSREMLAFGTLVSGVLAVVALEVLVHRDPLWANGLIPAWTCAALMGWVSVLTSVMIYVDTGRAAWNVKTTGIAFFATTALLGSGSVGVLLHWMAFAQIQDPVVSAAKGFCLATTAIRTGLFGFVVWRTRNARIDRNDPLFRTVQALDHGVPWLHRARLTVFMVATAFAMVSFVGTGWMVPLAASVSLLWTIGGQLLERWVFFVGCAPDRMPGMPR
jgi:formate dehydrogenase iron-sulfur subunit